jgi:alpha-amylase
MNKIHLSLAIHNHQPVGNFDWVFENATQLAYEPMIAALEQHPGVRLALHYTGPLRDWLFEHRPELMARVRALVERGQVEMLTGGYYEPILVALPDVDKAGQLHKLTAAVKKDFGCEATGAWLAERVWEPHLAKPLAEAGVQYTIVDDTHFKYVGLSDDDLFGYYVTEEQGYALKLFGSSKHLRYAVPWDTVPNVIEWLRGQADVPMNPDGRRVAVMGDDGEKFGLWPSTHTHCWENGWMDEFFTALEANSDWLIMTPPGEYITQYPALGRIYLPNASYDEMSEWALPAQQSAEFVALKRRLQDEHRDDILRYLKGGLWRSFMSKYPEVNSMHKKMLLVSEKVHRIKSRKQRAAALDALWAGQCNCPYWHGVFGGVYLFHIREATFERLIAAEAMADAETHGDGAWVSALSTDVDKDGRDEVILSSDAQSLLFAPALGGSLVEWDWRATGLNLGNTLTRRPEGYHTELKEAAARGTLVLTGQEKGLASIHSRSVRAKELGLQDKLYYDWYRRASLLDHVLAPDATLDTFYRCQYTELGDLANQPYTAQLTETGDRLTLKLVREGGVWKDKRQQPLRVEKTIALSAGQLALDVTYQLTNIGDTSIEARFGVETNWGIAGGDGPQAYSVWPGGDLVRLNALHAVKSANEVGLVHEWYGRVILTTDRAASWWQFPVETISKSEAGFERVYQGTSVTCHWPLALEPGATWHLALRFRLL